MHLTVIAALAIGFCIVPSPTEGRSLPRYPQIQPRHQIQRSYPTIRPGTYMVKNSMLVVKPVKTTTEATATTEASTRTFRRTITVLK